MVSAVVRHLYDDVLCFSLVTSEAWENSLQGDIESDNPFNWAMSCCKSNKRQHKNEKILKIYLKIIGHVVWCILNIPFSRRIYDFHKPVFCNNENVIMPSLVPAADFYHAGTTQL